MQRERTKICRLKLTWYYFFFKQSTHKKQKNKKQQKRQQQTNKVKTNEIEWNQTRKCKSMLSVIRYFILKHPNKEQGKKQTKRIIQSQSKNKYSKNKYPYAHYQWHGGPHVLFQSCRSCRPDDERVVFHCSKFGEGEGDRTARTEVLGVDRWLHPGLPVHLPADVDLQAGVRRVRTRHCSQEMFLRERTFLMWCFESMSSKAGRWMWVAELTGVCQWGRLLED